MASDEEQKLRDIAEAIRSIEYGSLQITVHQGQVTQIDTTEKKRYSNQRSK